MSQHTLAPWLPSRMTKRILNIVQVGGSFRCNVVGDDNGAMVSTVHGRTEKECEANACLIAAAPDLLEALTAIAGYGKMPSASMIESGPEWERIAAICNLAASAIAKATISSTPQGATHA